MKSKPTYQIRRTNDIPTKTVPRKKKRSLAKIKAMVALVLLMVIVGVSVYGVPLKSKADAVKDISTNVHTQIAALPTGPKHHAAAVSAPAQAPASSPASAPPNNCTSNTSSQLVLVNISKRHLWACSSAKEAYSSAVITGMENLPADLTPVGTYHIYGKTVNIHLKGSDSTGSWDDPVSYWMPFLDNKYGTYGFHDATWRQDSDFGNVDPNSTNASHGCIELPLATAKWLYNWAPVGTTVTVES